MPVVPRIDRPPIMPSRPLSVCFAISSPPGIGNLDLRVGAPRRASRGLGDRLAHHRARHRIDRRLARRQRQAGPRHRADARARANDTPAPGAAAAQGRAIERAMGHVRIVAGVLDDAGAREIRAAHEFGKGEGGAPPDGNAISTGSGGGAAGHERLESRARRRCGAGARRPAPPQVDDVSAPRSCVLLASRDRARHRRRVPLKWLHATSTGSPTDMRSLTTFFRL